MFLYFFFLIFIFTIEICFIDNSLTKPPNCPKIENEKDCDNQIMMISPSPGRSWCRWISNTECLWDFVNVDIYCGIQLPISPSWCPAPFCRLVKKVINYP